ncbi:MAG: sugar phosphate nucleotidyltransferase [Pirellulales bacterium]|nr:sugar phosphate nucleotidyltransferase [Pirellulales bacterium]
MLHAVIMAGGSGTRFWPASRNLRPKQLLKLAGDRTLLAATIDRLGKIIPSERVWIATGHALADTIRQELPGWASPPRSGQMLVEPCKRDTAACIGLAAITLLRRDPEAIMAVMPSDHVIHSDELFQQAIMAAAEIVRQRPERFVTFGIKPTYPAECFGYIERGAIVPNSDLPAAAPGGLAANLVVSRVAHFREKPAASVAREYLESGKFLWNSGIFVWSAATILAALHRYQPELARQLMTIQAALGRPDFATVLEREFSAMRGISIDYAVMEHARDVLVIEAPFQWDDVGSWQAIARLEGADAAGNTIRAKHLGINTTGTIVRSDDEHLIVTLGLQDCVVVRTADATLVARKQDEEGIRQVVKELEERGWREYL